MKTCGQVYVKGSVEAFELYKDALRLTTGMYCLNEDGTLEHADLKDGDNAIIAIAEDSLHLHSDRIADGKQSVMFFNVWDLGTREAVDHAYTVLSPDARWNENPDGPAAPWWDDEGKVYAFALIDKFGIHWWIAT